jgi:CheY-like chemotaxis protein
MPASRRKTHVLIVDDDSDTLTCYGHYLRTAGLHVTTAADAREAIVAAARTLPDVIVLDLVMPVLDGYAVMHGLRARSNTSQIPVVLFTGLTIEKIRSAPQVRALVRKPCTPLDLLSVVRMLGRRA